MPPAAAIRYFWEDFTPGWSYESGAASISAAGIKRFAQEYDPQPYHVDETAAKATPFRGLIAGGWHTCAIAMRLMCDGYLLESSCIGSPGLEELRWLMPARPDDRPHLRATVLEQTPSQTQRGRGTVKFRLDVLNQNGDVVCKMISRQHYLRRLPPSGKVRRRHELPVEGLCLNVSNRLLAATRPARGSGGHRP